MTVRKDDLESSEMITITHEEKSRNHFLIGGKRIIYLRVKLIIHRRALWGSLGTARDTTVSQSVEEKGQVICVVL